MSTDAEITAELAEVGWKRVPSTQGFAISPEIAPYWQRWQGDGMLDWIELPAGMPLRLVKQIIFAQNRHLSQVP